MNWEQLLAIVWLRWRLTRNRFARAGTLNTVLSILFLVLLLLGGAAVGVGGFLLGLLGLPKLDPRALLLVWDGAVLFFLFFWLLGLIVEIQRSESIDLPKLLHLPVTLRQVFVFNYLVSHFTPGIVLVVPGMVAAGAGLALGVGPRMAWLIPLVASFVFMISAWTYCLRGWLAALMVNKRRRRAVIVWVTIGGVLVAQLPNLVFTNSRLFGQRSRKAGTAQSQASGNPSPDQGGVPLPEMMLDAHLAIPIGWVGYGAMSLKQGIVWPTLAGLAAGGLIGALGLMRAYRTTLRFYQGAEELTKPRPVKSHDPNRPLLVERRLPWLEDDTAAFTLATFRSLLRAPEMKMALIAPVILLVVFGSLQLTRSGPAPAFFTPLAATAAAVMATFSLAQTMSNLFGLDRDGFRALVLLPIRRHQILFAKNLALFPFAVVIGLPLLVLGAFLFHMSWTVFLAGVLQIPAAFFSYSLVANLASVLVPYRLAPGSLQAKKPKAVVMLAVFATMLVMPVVMGPVVLPAVAEIVWVMAGWPAWLPVNLLGSIALLAGVTALYWAILPGQGRLLQRREQAILREVTEEIE